MLQFGVEGGETNFNPNQWVRLSTTVLISGFNAYFLQWGMTKDIETRKLPILFYKIIKIISNNLQHLRDKLIVPSGHLVQFHIIKSIEIRTIAGGTSSGWERSIARESTITSRN